LKRQGILKELDHGLIVTEGNLFKSGNNHDVQKTNVILFRKRDLTRAGIGLPGDI
jgi:hypothetical protein